MRIVSTVISKKNSKTGAIIHRAKVWNPTYEIYVGTQKKILFHDPEDITSVGDIVEIVNSGKKISKMKAFILDRIIHKNPVELGMMKDHIDSQEALKKLYHIEEDILGPQHVELRKEVPLHQLKMKQSKQIEEAELKQEERQKRAVKKARYRFNRKLKREGIDTASYWKEIENKEQV